MTTFLDEIYLPGPNEPRGVLPWGKSPEMTQKDLEEAVARIGGFRAPNYGQSYLLAANTLLRTAREAGALDHHGLPIFFLQRHAAELIMKGALQLGIEIQDFRAQLGRHLPNFPVDAAQRERAEGCHALGELFSDLQAMAAALNVGIVPKALGLAVEQIEATERHHHTWSRYSYRLYRAKGGKRLVSHTDQEVVVPLGSIQELLQAANTEMGTDFPSHGLMMRTLSDLWEELAQQAGLIE